MALNEALSLLPLEDQAAYQLAIREAPELVKTESDPLLFLKREKFNAWAAATPAKAPTAGVPTQAQFWFRDPQNTSNQSTSLSNAAQIGVCP